MWGLPELNQRGCCLTVPLYNLHVEVSPTGKLFVTWLRRWRHGPLEFGLKAKQGYRLLGLPIVLHGTALQFLARDVLL